MRRLPPAEQVLVLTSYMRQVADGLDELSPPADIASEHRGYVMSIREGVRGTRTTLIPLLRSGQNRLAELYLDNPVLRAVMFGGRSTERRVDRFMRAVQEGGYDLGLGTRGHVDILGIPGQSSLE